MHFTHGSRIGWSVDDVLRLAAGSTDPAVALAVSDANTAFADCVDRSVLAQWVTTPVCGTSDSVEGLASARCVALDAECRRGRFDEARGCCGEWDLFAGMVCGEGLELDHDVIGDAHSRGHASDRDDAHSHQATSTLMCDGRGGCVDPSTVPTSVRAQGVFTWVEGVRSDAAVPPTPSLWYTEPESDASPIELGLDGMPVTLVPGSQAGHRTRLAVSPPGSLGVVAVDLGPHSDATVRTLYVPRRISVNADLEHGETYEVCAAAGSFDGLGTLVGECEGDQRVTCPSAVGAPVTCTVDPRGFSVLTAAGLSIAWERDPPGPCAAPSCLQAFPDGGSQCVVFAPGSQVCLFAWPDGGVTCDLCPTAGDSGPPDSGPRDGGTDASVPPGTAVREPAPVAGLFVFQPVPIVPLHGPPPHVLAIDGGTDAGRVGPIHIGPQGPGGSCGAIPCTSSCGFGERLCYNNHYGSSCTAIATTETCNGRDDDCDGQTDEFTSNQCAGSLCEARVCLDGMCQRFTGATGTGWGFPGTGIGSSGGTSFGGIELHHLDSASARSCVHVGAPQCEYVRCDRADPTLPGGPSAPFPSIAVGDRILPPVAGTTDANGCFYIERDVSYCVDVAGGCGYGPDRVQCLPGAVTADPFTGCWTNPGSAIVTDPLFDTTAIATGTVSCSAPEATDCATDANCQPGERCLGARGVCITGLSPTANLCWSQLNCAPGQTCLDNRCVGGPLPLGFCQTLADCPPSATQCAFASPGLCYSTGRPLRWFHVRNDTLGHATTDCNGRYQFPVSSSTPLADGVASITFSYEANVPGATGISSLVRVIDDNGDPWGTGPAHTGFDRAVSGRLSVDPITGRRVLFLDEIVLTTSECELFRIGAMVAEDFMNATGSPVPRNLTYMRREGVFVSSASTPLTLYDYVDMPSNVFSLSTMNTSFLREFTLFHESGHVLQGIIDGDRAHWDHDLLTYQYGRCHQGREIAEEGQAFHEGWADYWRRARWSQTAGHLSNTPQPFGTYPTPAPGSPPVCPAGATPGTCGPFTTLGNGRRAREAAVFAGVTTTQYCNGLGATNVVLTGAHMDWVEFMVADRLMFLADSGCAGATPDAADATMIRVLSNHPCDSVAGTCRAGTGVHRLREFEAFLCGDVPACCPLTLARPTPPPHCPPGWLFDESAGTCDGNGLIFTAF